MSLLTPRGGVSSARYNKIHDTHKNIFYLTFGHVAMECMANEHASQCFFCVCVRLCNRLRTYNTFNVHTALRVVRVCDVRGSCACVCLMACVCARGVRDEKE